MDVWTKVPAAGWEKVGPCLRGRSGVVVACGTIKAITPEVYLLLYSLMLVVRHPTDACLGVSESI